MKHSFISSVLIMLAACMTSSFTTPTEDPTAPKSSPLIVTTDANGEIADIQGINGGYWSIRDLSGYTNIRNRPNGKVCMRLKAHTQYEIYTNGASGGWLRISSIYNMRERYWVTLHSSSTGSYWIAKSILYYNY